MSFWKGAVEIYDDLLYNIEILKLYFGKMANPGDKEKADKKDGFSLDETVKKGYEAGKDVAGKLFQKKEEEVERRKMESEEKRDMLRQNIEQNLLPTVVDTKFGPGEYVIEDSELPSTNRIMDKRKQFILEGKGDRIGFHKGSREKDTVKRKEGAETVELSWYKQLASDALLFLKVKDFLKIDFPSLKSEAKKKRIFELVEKIAELDKSGEIKDEDFKTAVKSFSDSEVYGPEGALNLLVIFQRAVSTVPREFLYDASEENKFLAFNLKEIRLKVSGKGGARKDDRYARLMAVDRFNESRNADAVSEPESDEVFRGETINGEPVSDIRRADTDESERGRIGREADDVVGEEVGESSEDEVKLKDEIEEFKGLSETVKEMLYALKNVEKYKGQVKMERHPDKPFLFLVKVYNDKEKKNLNVDFWVLVDPMKDSYRSYSKTKLNAVALETSDPVELMDDSVIAAADMDNI